MILAIFTILFFYLMAMGWVLLGTLKLRPYKLVKTTPKTSFSIIVPFRNEVNSLPHLLESIAALEYPLELFEVILVNDDSEDGSLELLQKDMDDLHFKLHIFQNKRNSQSPKKDAITTALAQAQFSWILTTDADCKLPSNWLRAYDQFIQERQPKMICGPVVYNRGKTLAQQFQFLDGLSLQAVTIGSFGWKKPLLSNGANLGYEKSVFKEVNGYKGNNHIASGDDMFLLEKVLQKFPEKVHYLKAKEATVETETESSWKQLITQRIRWASKTTKQKNAFTKALGIIVFTTNLAFIVCLLCCLIDPTNYRLYGAFILHKLVFDLFVMTSTSLFLNKAFSIGTYLISGLIYPFISVWVVISSLGGSYQWKGRTFDK